MSDFLISKYGYYHSSNLKSRSKKQKNVAAKKGNTADNLIPHFNKFWEYITNMAHNTGTVVVNNQTIERITQRIEEFKNDTEKDQKAFVRKLRNSLESQDRVYKDVICPSGNKRTIAFPITLIKTILGGRLGLKEWEDSILGKLKIMIDNKGNYLKIEDIESVRIIPKKKTIIKNRNNKKDYTLRSRADINSAPKKLQAGDFSDISIGHMPALSDVIRDLESNQLNPLPGIERLTQIIEQYCNTNGKTLAAELLRKEYKKIYSANSSSCSSLAKQLIDDLKLLDSKEEYELQSKVENIIMGGSNRK